MSPDSFTAYEASLSIPREVATPDLSESQIATITREVFMPHQPGPAEVLFLFGTVQADWDGLAELILAGCYDRIVLAGRISPTYFEDEIPIAERMAQELVLRSVSRDAIRIQPYSDNTLQDVELSLPHMGQPATIAYAAKSHHSGRCQRTLRRFFPKSKLTAHTHDARYGDVTVAPDNWPHHHVAVGRVMGEWQRIQKYASKGDISPDC